MNVVEANDDDRAVFARKLCLTGLYYWGVLGLGMASAVVGPTLDAIGHNIHVENLSSLSMIFVLRAFFYFFGSTTAGWVVTKYKCGYETLFISLVWSAAMLSLVPRVVNAKVMFALFCSLGLGSGVLTNIPQALTIELWRESNVGPYLQALHFCYGVGATLSPLVVHTLIGTASALNAYYYIAGFHLLGAALMVLAHDLKRDFFSQMSTDVEPKPDVEGVSRDETTYLLASSIDEGSIKREQAALDQRRQRRRRLERLAVLLMAIFIFLYVGNEVASGGLLYSFAKRGEFRLSPSSSALLTTVYWLFFSLGRLVSVPLSIHMTPKAVLSLSLAGVFASVIALQSSVVVKTEKLLWFAVCALGLSNGPIYGSAIVVLEEHVAVTGNVISALVAGDTLGEMIIPGVVGSLMSAYGPNNFVLGVGGASLSASALYIAAWWAVLRALPRPELRRTPKPCA
eukprot:g155.t1